MRDAATVHRERRRQARGPACFDATRAVPSEPEAAPTAKARRSHLQAKANRPRPKSERPLESPEKSGSKKRPAPPRAPRAASAQTPTLLPSVDRAQHCPLRPAPDRIEPQHPPETDLVAPDAPRGSSQMERTSPVRRRVLRRRSTMTGAARKTGNIALDGDNCLHLRGRCSVSNQGCSASTRLVE